MKPYPIQICKVDHRLLQFPQSNYFIKSYPLVSTALFFFYHPGSRLLDIEVHPNQEMQCLHFIENNHTVISLNILHTPRPFIFYGNSSVTIFFHSYPWSICKPCRLCIEHSCQIVQHVVLGSGVTIIAMLTIIKVLV